MGKVLSTITRPLRNFNIESRAHKVISKSKPTPAPIHEASLKEAEKLLEEYPESYTNLLKKDVLLDKNLKNVFVKSYDPLTPNPIKTEDPNRPLPLNRKVVVTSEFGFDEPNVIPVGRCTLRQALKILSNYQSNPDVWDSKKEALHYKISEETIDNIIKYFRVYHVHIPDKDTKVIYGAPTIPKSRQIESNNR